MYFSTHAGSSISLSLIKNVKEENNAEEVKVFLTPSEKPNDQEEEKNEVKPKSSVPKKISNKQKKRLEKQKLKHEKYLQNKK
jgi:hypothetical protein